MSHTALVDGDIVAWRAAFLTEGNAGSVHDLQELISGIISEWCRLAGCQEYIVCLSVQGKPTFRHKIYKKYKGNRKGRETPKFLKQAYGILKEEHPSIQNEGLEADDLMGILATNKSYPHPVIVTIDKDLRTVPGIHFNPTKERVFAAVAKESATRNFCRQWLTGDPGDGYPGLPGCGPKKAAVILEDPDPVSAVQQAYCDAGLTWEECVTQARLAKILSAGDCKVRKDGSFEPIMYTPPKAACWRKKPAKRHKKVH